ncbi:ankyrin repeat-containing domain protein [Xylaria scruposa]|nr:ankyrin repeat-containing domain protein [Xylaria scruposa]
MSSQTVSQVKSHGDYTVGWICALPKEQTAATAMLDQIHPPLRHPTKDYNTYTLGSIGSHNIVIACLPKGTYGNNSAATAAVQMANTFPSIRFGLLVGIGGGIPPKVRLGDVVISAPIAEYPGVVQWDIGKGEKDGKFQRTGALNRPPRTLLTAVTKLETRHEMYGSKIPQYLAELEKIWPKLAPRYSRCSFLKDPLVTPENSHCRKRRRESMENEAEQSMNNTSEPRTGKDSKDVRIHYGLVASGNMVIKDAKRRDDLNNSLGGNILCVEMEAAGLMNDFPCIVIRGICDYADAQKNKDWQEYAAAIAAGCAKELLEYVHPDDVDNELPAKDILSKVLSTVSKTSADVENIQVKLDNQEENRILTWLSPVNYSSDQNTHINTRQPGTGQWLLNSKVYKDWINTRNRTLFCQGIPGAGKTTLASIVIENLLNARAAECGRIGVAYIYCNFRRQDELTPDKLLRNLLKQLASMQSLLPDDVRKLHHQSTKEGAQPSLDNFYGALQSVSALYSNVFIVVDALDECQSMRSLSTLLSYLFTLRTETCTNIFATSRHNPTIQKLFEGHSMIMIEIKASNEDIRRYIDGRMLHLPTFLHKSKYLQEEVIAKIVEVVDGMFLLARLYLDSIEDQTSMTEMRNTLKRLKRRDQNDCQEIQNDDVLDKAYDQAWERILSQKKGHQSLGKRVLCWITCAKRPLTTLELQHALAINIGDTELDKNNLREVDLMTSVCAGLVTVDEMSGIIRLVHYTTQEYFEGRRERLFSIEEPEIAISTIKYLSFDVFEDGACQSNWDFKQRLKLHPFYKYAACYWGHHARDVGIEDGQLALNFLNCNPKITASSEVIMYYWTYRRNQASAVHLAAGFGLWKAIMELVRKGHDPNATDDFGRTPLVWAIENGHHKTVQVLLATEKIDPNLRGDCNASFPWSRRKKVWDGEDPKQELLLHRPGYYYECGATPLWYAAWAGDYMAVEWLLATTRVDPNYGDDYFSTTPLWCAAGNGHEVVVKLLLANNSEIDGSPYGGMTPLLIAAMNGYEAIVGLLLEKGADPSHVDDDGQTALMRATWSGHDGVIKVLLADQRVNVNFKDKKGWDPLLLAAYKGHEAVVKLLLSDPRVDANSVDSHGRTPLALAATKGNKKLAEILWTNERVRDNSASVSIGLFHAVENGYIDIVRLFIDEVNYDSKQNAVISASMNGHGMMVKFLLAAYDMDPNLQNSSGETLLFLAAEAGHIQVVESLLQTSRVNLERADPHRLYTPLIIASLNGHEMMVKLLLERGAKPECTDRAQRTALFFAAAQGRKQVLGLLIASKRVDVNLTDHYGSTPLSAAVRNGHDVVVDLLLATGQVDTCSQDKFGRSPFFWAAKNGHTNILNSLLEDAKRKGILVSVVHLPTEKKETSDRKKDKTCSVCMQAFAAFFRCYCRFCGRFGYKGFLACEDCKELGARCLEASHEMPLVPWWYDYVPSDRRKHM